MEVSRPLREETVETPIFSLERSHMPSSGQWRQRYKHCAEAFAKAYLFVVAVLAAAALIALIIGAIIWNNMYGQPIQLGS